MAKIFRVPDRIEWKNFCVQAGNRLLLDDIHLNGKVFLPGSGMTHIPFETWIKDGWLVEEPGPDIEMITWNKTYTNKKQLLLEPMFHFIRQNMSRLHGSYLKHSIMKSVQELTLFGDSLDSEYSLTGAEVGVHTGENAFRILVGLPIKKLYLIDPYHENPDYQYGNPDLEQAKEIAHKNLKRFSDKIEWMHMSSFDALQQLEDLDFCYHDSDHRRPCVQAELPLGYAAVRPGGVWGGHDYKNTLEGECEVKACVDEFFIAHKLSRLWYSSTQLNWWHVKRGG